MKPHLRTLPVKLDPHEVAQRAAELARELHDQAVAEEEAASTKKKLAKDLEARAARIARLGRVVHTRREDRQIDCHEEHRSLDGTARTIRDDTQEIVDTRPLTQEELREARQESLLGGAPERSGSRPGLHREGPREAQGEGDASGGSMSYAKVTFRDLDTGKQWSWRMRADVAAKRAAEHVAAWAADGQRVEVVS